MQQNYFLIQEERTNNLDLCERHSAVFRTIIVEIPPHSLDAWLSTPQGRKKLKRKKQQTKKKNKPALLQNLKATNEIVSGIYWNNEVVKEFMYFARVKFLHNTYYGLVCAACFQDLL